jgi:tetratricopeptide (TPR) repeat protein
VEAFLAAARDAEKLPSYRAAVTFYRQAWEAADVGLEEHPDADEHFRRLSLAAALGLCRMTVFYSAPVDPGNVDRAAQRGEELAQSLGDTETLANLYALHGMITTAKGPEKFPQGLALVEKALAVASQAGLTLPVVSISRALAWTYLLDGRFQQAREKIDWVMAELERAGHRERLSDVYFGARWFWTSVRAFGDDLAPAEKTLMETVELAVQANNRTAHAGSAAGLAQIHMMRGEYTEAKRWADRSLDIAQAIDNVSAMRIAASIAVTARRELGEPVEAPRYLELLDQGLALTGTLPLSIRVIVEGFLALGEPKRAQYAAQVACERAGGRLSQMLAAEALGEAELRLGPDRWSEAACAFDRAIALADELGSRSTLAIALLGAAELAAAKGNRERSAPMLERALTIARRLGLTRYLERADRILAMLDAGPQPPA